MSNENELKNTQPEANNDAENNSPELNEQELDNVAGGLGGGAGAGKVVMQDIHFTLPSEQMSLNFTKK
jgi:hypothetical protein